MNDDEDPMQLVEILRLGPEVYGEDFGTFLSTPRRSLDGETPADLLERGDFRSVLTILINVLEGHFD